VLGTIGDLLEDVIVDLGGPINIASDTDAVVHRRRGGSAANVAVAAARRSGRSRFIGQVGDDAAGRALTDELVAVGVETVVRREGRTGTIVVLVHDGGERTMLSDRAAAVGLTDPDPAWLDGLHVLHVPLYSLTVEPLAATTRELVRLARSQGLVVSVDASSTALMTRIGVAPTRELIGELGPAVLFANEAEADLLRSGGPLDEIGAKMVVTRHGPGPAVIIGGGEDASVDAPVLSGVTNTTGAGDAFAAGFMLSLADGADPATAARAGHAAAAAVIEHDGRQ
jgi:sugar/nucleoside kinase (ribokinase family)